jgi:hypothetical protein
MRTPDLTQHPTQHHRHKYLTDDERAALDAGYGCPTCLDFGDLPGLGPCADCQPDQAAERLLGEAEQQLGTTWNDEHDDWEVLA